MTRPYQGVYRCFHGEKPWGIWALLWVAPLFCFALTVAIYIEALIR